MLRETDEMPSHFPRSGPRRSKNSKTKFSPNTRKSRKPNARLAQNKIDISRKTNAKPPQNADKRNRLNTKMLKMSKMTKTFNCKLIK